MLITRGLLLAGYLFLFAGQFNYRYFTIANFYVYHSNSGISGIVQDAVGGRAMAMATIIHTVGAVRRTELPAAAILHDNAQRPAHLGIDKRFSFRQGIRVPQIRAPAPPEYPVAKIRYYTPIPVCFSTDLPTTPLRGPPCA